MHDAKELTPPFHFDDYTLRIATQDDLPLASAWTAADPDHAGTDTWFWVRQSATVNSFLLEDEDGLPVFFFRMEIASDGWEVEVHIQFDPDESLRQRERTMTAMMAGFAWLEKRLGDAGFRVLYFYSRRHELIKFCEKRMGFSWDGRRLERKVNHGEAEREEEKRPA